MHEQGGLADAGLTPEQDQASADDAPSEHPVQLSPRQAQPRGVVGRHLGEGYGAGRLHRLRPCGLRRLPDLKLLERVPGPAVRALAGPSEALAAAFGADKGDGRFRHGETVYR